MKGLEIKELQIAGYEKVIEASYPKAGLICFIAIHNTSLGPALGGTRIYPYSSKEAALQDALRLAKAMTYKSAIAQDGLGGGKSVIIANPHTQKSEELLLAFAEVVNTLGGRYIAAEDVGTNTQDMAILKRRTPFVAALPSEKSSGDPSRFTAWGVFVGMKAAALTLWNNPSLEGRRVAIQGLGNVGSKLTQHLFWEGADLVITDTDMIQAQQLAFSCGAVVVPPEKILSIPCDIFAPCALGGILNKKTAPTLHCKVVAGSANNQLAEESMGEFLFEKGILYAPDFVINAGGIINAAAEFDLGGYHAKGALAKVNQIFTILQSIFKESKAKKISTARVSAQLAEYNLKHEIGKRVHPIQFQ